MSLALLQRLLRDKIFALALVLGPLFWWCNHIFELSQPVPNLSLSFLLLVALLYPLLEELAFRGAIQGGLLQMAWGRPSILGLSVANGLSTLLFVLFHLSSQGVLWSAAVLLPSLLFGFLRERYSSTAPGIIVHCFYNFGFFVLR